MRQSILPFRRSILDGVLRYDPILQFYRRWLPTYQDVGGAGAIAVDVLRWARGFWLVGWVLWRCRVIFLVWSGRSWGWIFWFQKEFLF